METRVAEIADGIHQLTTHVPEMNFSFNQYLVTGDEPLLFHTGPRQMFPLVSDAVGRVLPVDQLRWISFGHVESDECGSMNNWLGAAPQSTVAQGMTGCMVSLTDLADRAPRPLADGEVLDIGGHRMRWIDTPHVPHGWEAGAIYEEIAGTLFCGDLLTHGGDPTALTEADVLGAAIAMEDASAAMTMAPRTGATLRGLAALAPATLALMHGSSFRGDGAAALNGLASYCERRALEMVA